MKKIIYVLPLICLSLFLVFPTQEKVNAAATYPVPHRSWIKLGLVAYQSSMTPEQLDWTARNIDWFDSPYPVFLPQYKAKTDAPMLLYDNYYCLYVGQEKYNALVDYVNTHGLNLESMFLHFDAPTTVSFLGVALTLPVGSRVPTYGWYGTGGDLTKNNARVIMNANNADYRAFNAEYELAQVNKQYNGATYDGIFVDNSARYVLTNAGGTISAGGTIAEYPGKTRDEAKVLYDQDLVSTFELVRIAFGSKGAAGSKLQVPNSSYDNWTAIFPYIDGIFREFMIQPTTNNVAGEEDYIKRMAESNAAGVPSIVSAIGLGSTNTDLPREKMTSLARFYLAATDIDYFARQDKNSQDPQTFNWFPALDYNVGHAIDSSYLFAQGADPSSAKFDSGTGTVTNNGAVYTLADPTKNWATDYWVGTTLTDSNNNTFGVYHSGNNWISFYRNSAPYPVSGAYQIGNFIYKIFAREYDYSLMLDRPKSSWNSNDLSDLSAITKNLPVTSDNPTGIYHKLNADGTVDLSPLTQITLRNAEGVILIKASALNRPTISKTVDKLTAGSGETLTYTLSYSNPTQISFANTRIEDLLPTGTSYVNGSATGGATFDSTNNRIILAIGNLAAGANGTITFKVMIQ